MDSENFEENHFIHMDEVHIEQDVVVCIERDEDYVGIVD